MSSDVLIIGASALIAVLVAWSLPAVPALGLSVVLGILQVYPTSHVTVSLAAIWQLATWLTVYRNRAALPRLRALGYPYAALVLVSAIVLLWSSDPTSGITLIAQLLGLGATTALAIIVARVDRGSRVPVYWLLAGLLAVSSVTILVFRFAPGVEDAYFRSPLFGALNGNDLAAHFFTTQRNNVLDTTKSGGIFFVNANAASLFAGASAALLGARAAQSGPRPRVVLAAVAVLDLVAALATGSKTAVYLAGGACVVLGLAVAVLWRTGAHRPRALVAAALSVTVGAGIVALPLLLTTLPSVPAIAAQSAGAPTPAPAPSIAPTVPSAPADETGLASQSAEALGTRTQIWQVAAVLFKADPIGTFGYGGWHDRYAPIAVARGLEPGFPPHNWVIATWADTGPAGVVLVLVILVVVALSVGRRLTSGDRASRLAAAIAAIALAWVVVHGLGDNTGFYGGPRLIPIVALAVGIATEFGATGPTRRRNAALGDARPAGSRAGADQ